MKKQWTHDLSDQRNWPEFIPTDVARAAKYRGFEIHVVHHTTDFTRPHHTEGPEVPSCLALTAYDESGRVTRTSRGDDEEDAILKMKARIDFLFWWRNTRKRLLRVTSAEKAMRMIEEEMKSRHDVDYEGVKGVFDLFRETNGNLSAVAEAAHALNNSRVWDIATGMLRYDEGAWRVSVALEWAFAHIYDIPAGSDFYS